MFACKCNVTLYDNFLSRERKAQKLKKRKQLYIYIYIHTHTHLYIFDCFPILTACFSKDLRLTKI